MENNYPLQVQFRENCIYRRARRLFDLTVASVALAAATPVLLLASIAIALDDGGPILFRQQRVGRYGKLFVMYKLRTMRTSACGDALKPTSGADARVTRVGRFLRKASIDELPQLFNVLRGEMAIVGPRPEMPLLVRKYERWQHLRHLAKPGVTGLWQITCRSSIPLHQPEATHIDLEYIRTASAMTDGLIVLRTFRALVSARGAY
jgi:lipopolysaccharide/colanic/teichoic acid biosynthesis glycosyltransferase